MTRYRVVLHVWVTATDPQAAMQIAVDAATADPRIRRAKVPAVEEFGDVFVTED